MYALILKTKAINNSFSKRWLIHLDGTVCRSSNICSKIAADISLVFDSKFIFEFLNEFVSFGFLGGKNETIIHVNYEDNLPSIEKTRVDEALLEFQILYQAFAEVVEPCRASIF